MIVYASGIETVAGRFATVQFANKFLSPTFKSLGVVDRGASLAVTVRKDVTDMTSTRFDWSWSSLKRK